MLSPLSPSQVVCRQTHCGAAGGKAGAGGVRRRISFGVGGPSLSAAVGGTPPPVPDLYVGSGHHVRQLGASSTRHGGLIAENAMPASIPEASNGRGEGDGEGHAVRRLGAVVVVAAREALAEALDDRPRVRRMVGLARVDLARAILVGVPAFFVGAIVLSLSRVMDAARTSPALSLLAVPVLMLTVFVTTRTRFLESAAFAGRLGARAVLNVGLRR